MESGDSGVSNGTWRAGGRLEKYAAPRPGRDHDHREFWPAKFAGADGDGVLRTGYCTREEYCWVCPDCFEDFREGFGWTVRDAATEWTPRDPKGRGAPVPGGRVTTLEPVRRPLEQAERRLLRCRIRRHRARPRRVEAAAGLAAAGVAAVLWVATLAASDAPWPAVTAFWLVLGFLIYVWVVRALRRETAHLPAMVAALESARERNEVEAFEIAAERYAELEEVEDEGACWAFDLGDGWIVFLGGQEFYPSARFPSLDFSVVFPLDASGEPADMWIRKRGEAVSPERVLPAAVKRELAGGIPASLEVVRGSLDDLEIILRDRVS